MPRPSVEYIPRPYVRPAYEPDTRTMMDLLRLSGASRANTAAQQGQNRAAGIFTIGKLISDALSGIQDERMQREVLAAKQAESDRDESFRRDQLSELGKEREFNRQTREEAAREKKQADAYRMGGDMAEAIEYGPVDESQVDPLMAGPAAGRVRYAFGPGTADGPELQPSPSQQRGIQSQQALEKMGAVIGPNGQIVMPEKPAVPPTPESRLSGEDLLAYLAAQGNQGAINALRVKREQRPPSVVNDNQPLMPMIGADGKTRYGTRAEARGSLVPSGSEKPSSGVQKRVLNFFNRAEQADRDLEGLEGEIQKMGLAGQTRMAVAPNFAQSQTGQAYTQAQRAFTEARLRKDSGAAIPETEFENDRKTYFAQPGDSTETLDQKRRARAAVLASLAFESGQALGEFLGSADDANGVIQSYRDRSSKKAAPADPIDALIKKYGGG